MFVLVRVISWIVSYFDQNFGFNKRKFNVTENGTQTYCSFSIYSAFDI